MRDSFIFYRSFFDAIKELDKSIQAEIYNAVFEYSFYDNKVELSGIPKTVFTLIEPQLIANKRRYEKGVDNGKKGAEFGKLGGRPKTPKKPLKNPQKTPKKPSNVNVNNNKNENENKNNNLKIYHDEKDDFFETLWMQYPKRDGKKASERHFKASVLTGDDMRDIAIAITNYKKYLEINKTEMKFIKSGSTWFNNWRDWVDWVEPVIEKPKTLEEKYIELQKRKELENATIDE